MHLSKSELRAKNRDAGRYFFSPDTMRFFKSRLETDGFSCGINDDGEDMGNYFVISNTPPDGKVFYEVCYMCPVGYVHRDTKDYYLRFNTLSMAKHVAQSAAQSARADMYLRLRGVPSPVVMLDHVIRNHVPRELRRRKQEMGR